MTAETGLVIAVIAGYPVCFLIGYYLRKMDRISRLARLRKESQDSRASYLARLEAHRLAWKNWTDESMRETQGETK